MTILRLVPRRAPPHKRAAMDQPQIFDRATRRLRRDRIARRFGEYDFLRRFMLEGLEERLGAVTREFCEVLDLGCFNGGFDVPGARVARLDAGRNFASGGVQADEDLLPFADASFDLVVSAGVLDTVNDVPGALSLVRRVLRPDGLFLGAFAGAGSLSTLRACLREVEGGAVARLHPQIDVRSAGDLLVRAGLALPVADGETLSVRYASVFRLLHDLRGMGAANVMPGRVPLTRAKLAQLADAFAARADADGRTLERFEVVFVTGWAPDESQPKPARRGSASASLADALKPR